MTSTGRISKHHCPSTVFACSAVLFLSVSASKAECRNIRSTGGVSLRPLRAYNLPLQHGGNREPRRPTIELSFVGETSTGRREKHHPWPLPPHPASRAALSSSASPCCRSYQYPTIFSHKRNARAGISCLYSFRVCGHPEAQRLES